MLVFTIAGRELKSYFTTVIGWLVLALWLFVAGVIWGKQVTAYVDASLRVGADPYASTQFTYANMLLMPFFSTIAVVLILIVGPALSMRLFADEVKSRTIELLLTSPVSTIEIVLGKFLGALGYVAILFLGTAYVPLTLILWGELDPGVLFGGYVAMFSIAAAVIAIGMLFSASTNSSLVALILTFGVSLVLWLAGAWSDDSPDSIVYQVSFVNHFMNFARGVFDLSDIVYYVAFIGFFLFATQQRVDAYRWS